METAAATLGAEAGSILLYDDEGRLRFHTASGQAASAVKPMYVEAGQGIAGWVASTGRSALVNDVANDSRFERRFDRATGFVTRSILCVPLTFEKRVIGVLELLNKKTGDFGAEDETLLGSLGDQAAISIDLLCKGENLLTNRPPPHVNLHSMNMGIHEWAYDSEIDELPPPIGRSTFRAALTIDSTSMTTANANADSMTCTTPPLSSALNDSANELRSSPRTLEHTGTPRFDVAI